jgi:dihydroxyacetone kinase-like protein
MTGPAATDLTLARAGDWMRRFGQAIQEQKASLSELDAAIGDGDHGINMERGALAVQHALDVTPPADLGTLFQLVGSTLISTVGGASGPLYGTAFLRMGGALAGKASASALEVGAALEVAYEGMAARGKSRRGDKTILDAFGPAVEAFQGGQSNGAAVPEAAAQAARAAEEGMRETIPMLATRGRASFLGERSRGHQDPGATSTYLLFRALADSLAS